VVLACSLLLAALAAIVCFQLSRRSAQPTQPSTAIGSLAVLPFKSWATESEDKYLGLGITDALITRLSNLNQVIVRPTTAVRKYDETEQDPVSAGRELKVDSALEDSISKRVVEALTLKLTSQERARLAKHYTENAQAYQLYLKGRYYSSSWTLEGFRKAVRCFNDAIALDPTYALAYAGLADAY